MSQSVSEKTAENLLRKIAEKNKQVEKARTHYLVSAEKTKAAKKLLEGQQDQLEALIRETTKDYPLFDSEPEPQDPEAWRVCSVTELEKFGTTGNITVKLMDASIPTIGALADWSTAGKLLTDIPGIGESKAEAIQQALEQFWATHRTDASIVEELPDGGDVEPPSGGSWREVPLARILTENQELALLLEADDVITVGDITDFLANGDLLSELEIADEDQADSQFRKLTEDEVKALQFALFQFREERGGDVLEELPIGWLMSEPWDQKVFEVRWKPTRGKEREPYYLRAYSQLAAADYAASYWPGKVREVVEVESIPDRAKVDNVPANFGNVPSTESVA